MQKFERIVQEDLDIGVNRVWIQSPGRGKLCATQVGLHTFARGLQAYEADWTPGTLAAGGYATTTLTVPDAVAGDMVLASHTKVLTNDLNITGHVSAANTAKIVLHNPASASVALAAGTARVIVFPFPGVSTTVEASVYVTWNQNAEDGVVSFTAHYGALNVNTFDWDFGEGAGTETDVGNPITNLYGGSGEDATYTVVLTVNAVEGVFQDSFQMTTNYAAGQSGSSQ